MNWDNVISFLFGLFVSGLFYNFRSLALIAFSLYLRFSTRYWDPSEEDFIFLCKLMEPASRWFHVFGDEFDISDLGEARIVFRQIPYMHYLTDPLKRWVILVFVPRMIHHHVVARADLLAVVAPLKSCPCEGCRRILGVTGLGTLPYLSTTPETFTRLGGVIVGNWGYHPDEKRE
jgi:hypothetical protein